jgi:potassium/hydrogen antiporter
VTLNERVGATLEIESGMNDPMAVYLTLAFIALLGGAASGGAAAGVPESATASVAATATAMLLSFVQQFGWGALIGVAAGVAMALLMRRLTERGAEAGILALLLGAGGLSVFAATGMVGGSGFLAVYLFGLIVAHRATDSVAPTLAAIDGYAWLSQAGMFLMLGLLVTPSSLLDSLTGSLAVAAVLMFVARPVAVWLCLWPFHFNARETWFISWVGLRGAVPIVLALFPLLAGTPQAGLLFNTAFVVVLVSLVTQGATLGLMARRLGVALPDPGDERQVRAAFGDFELDPQTPLQAICAFYGLPAPAAADQPLGDWMEAELRRPPVVGDEVHIGPAMLVVRELREGHIVRVGLGLQA